MYNFKNKPRRKENTRKNIGVLDPEEAAKMTKILGGEIGVEKTPLYDEPNIKKVRTYAHRSDAKKTDTPVNRNTKTNITDLNKFPFFFI